MRSNPARLPLALLMLTLTALLPAAGPLAQPADVPGEMLDRIIAVVDDGVVLQSELDAQMELVARQLAEQGTRMPPRGVLRQQVLESLIIRQVQLQRAARIGVRITDEQLNLALQQIAARNDVTLSELPRALAADGVNYSVFREQVREELVMDTLRQRDVVPRIAVSEREIRRWIEQQDASRGSQLDYDISQLLVALPQDPTAEQIEAAEARIRDMHARLQAGVDFAEMAVAESDGQQALAGGNLGWRRGSQLPQQFAAVILALQPGQFSDPVRSSSGFHIFRLNATRGGDERVVQFQTKARHILLMPNEVLDDAAIRTRLEAIRQRVLDGESFADIAMLESDDPASATRGGDLGWNPPGTFVPQFEAQLAALDPGEISEPFESPFGWHIIQLLDRGERDTTEEIRRMQAVQAIRASKQEQETELWLRRLRDESWVDIRGG
jgi:peptidyl-prolyl cis-trans isomerase SurA